MHTSDKILPWWLSGLKKKKKKICLLIHKMWVDTWFGKIPGKRAMHSSILAWELPWTEEPVRIWVFLVALW